MYITAQERCKWSCSLYKNRMDGCNVEPAMYFENTSKWGKRYFSVFLSPGVITAAGIFSISLKSNPEAEQV
jgi:hypothetical protein